MGEAKWRAMTPDDLDRVVEIARIAFPNHPESRACFAERLALNPSGCFVLTEGDDPALGYLIAYPWTYGSAPALDTLIGSLPEMADLIYLHDLALAPEARGRKLAEAGVAHLVEAAGAAGWSHITLVAVNDATPFWTRQGFVADDNPEMTRKLASYGDSARYMVRAL